MKYILYSLTLLVSLLLSSDSFPEYNHYRGIIWIVGSATAFIAFKTNAGKRILLAISVLEILLSFPVIMQKHNVNQELLQSEQLKKYNVEKPRLIDCTKTSSQWALIDCERMNDKRQAKRELLFEAANKDVDLPLSEYVSRFPSLIVFLAFTVMLPIISLLVLEVDTTKQEPIAIDVNARRLQVKTLLESGKSVGEVADTLGVSRKLIYNDREFMGMSRKKEQKVIQFKDRKKA